MNILITGAAGYIGTRLCQQLSKDHNVIGIDNLLFDQGHLTYPAMRNVNFSKIDTNDIVKYFDLVLPYKIDVCFPLSCLVGMPICKNNPNTARRTNKDSIVELINKLPQDCKIILPSTNSGYGKTKGTCDETTTLNSVSLYGKLKEELEKEVLKRGNAIIFRLATVFGLSARPRLDLLVNSLTYDAYFDDVICIFDNQFMRNYVHIFDVINGFLFGLDNFEKMRDNIYNLGNDKLNCTKEELAKKIQKHAPYLVKIENITGNDPDTRDYQVSSEKLYKLGFKPQYDLDWGINELVDYYKILPVDKEKREMVTQCMRNDKFIAKHDY